MKRPVPAGVRHLLATLTPALLTLTAPAAPPVEALANQGDSEPLAFLHSPGRIVFLGDSITHAGHYVTMLETHFLQRGQAVNQLEWINLGLPSETCSGLSEPAHPFPRPDVHERLVRALEKTAPHVVFACYGMNDAIYHPFDAGRFEAYQKGIHALVAKAKATGAFVVLLTPPPFDPLPMRLQGKLVPADGTDFAWHSIYEDYDQVIKRYADWILTQADEVDFVIDIHTPIAEALSERRKSEPDYAMSKDGVHINVAGHQIIAEAILEALRTDPLPLDEKLFAQVSARQAMMHAAWLDHIGHSRPGMQPGLSLAEARTRARDTNGIIKAWAAYAQQRERIRLLEEDIASLAQDIHAAQIRLGDRYVRFLFPARETPVALSNGRDLQSWEGDPKYWSVEPDGTIRGANEGPVPSSTYLFTKRAYREFRLIFEVRQTMSPEHSTMHSAVAVLGERFEDAGPNPYGFKGLLLMFCHDWGIWDAHRRNRTVPPNQRGPMSFPAEKKGDWNLLEFLVVGNRIRCAANGVEVFDFTDQPDMLMASPIGLQLHSNAKPQEFRFRHLYVSEAPSDELVTPRLLASP